MGPPQGLEPPIQPIIFPAPTPASMPSVYITFELANVDYAFLEETIPSSATGKPLNLMMLNASAGESGWKLAKRAGRAQHGTTHEESMKEAIEAAVEGILTSLGGKTKVTRKMHEDASQGEEDRDEDGDENHIVSVSFQPGPCSASDDDEESLLQAFGGAKAMVRRPHAALLNKGRRQHTHKRHHEHTTYVQVDIVDRPGTGRDHTMGALEVLSIASASGALEEALNAEIAEATGFDAEIGAIDVEKAVIVQWDTKKCAKHMKSLVTSFERSYTRAQVPLALYHACTNFRTKMSFSHDPIINSHDKQKCHQATNKLSKLWDYGCEDVDYQNFCTDLCSIKYGEGALRCVVNRYKKMGK